MSRPSGNTDLLLIEEARKLLPKTGCTGLNLREVASKAGVNLGMFHYHFKTKEEFTRRVLETVYEEFFLDFSMEVSRDESSINNLRSALNSMGRFSRNNRALILSLIRDALNGDREVVRFVKKNFGRHFGVLVQIIRQCQKTGEIAKEPLPLIMAHLLGTVGVPHLIFELLERSSTQRPFGLALSFMRKTVLSDAAIEKRVERSLKGWRK